ncbi:BMP family ABC transporter substrate-binding protein [Candidatus Atribacteria bacterium HGW-Atribacteria-1]|nr:MAG: BMP family ABC transporter substrate-binding protein [Candidatus Atribacteria bacterium HGW-Atribacteria-1]
MKKNLLGVVVLAIILSLCLSSTVFAAEAPLKVGLVFDVGGKGDKSFNDSAFRGLEMAEEDFGIEFFEIEPGTDADREVNVRNLAMMGYDLVIGVGFFFDDAIRAVATEFPETKFAVVDGWIPDMPNVVSLRFKEQDGSFLVGMIAGMKTKEDGKDIVGFVGGMDIPLIWKFQAGYKAGVQYVYPECNFLSAYAGDTGAAWIDPVKGKELALSQIDKGAYVIYHAAGLTGTGVFEAAKERKIYAIGVDSNQNFLGHIEETGENFGLVSMLKQVDVSVYLTIKAMVEGIFKSGIEEFGLDRRIEIGDKVYYGVYYAMDEYNEKLVTPEMIARVEEAKENIIQGNILVPTE